MAKRPAGYRTPLPFLFAFFVLAIGCEREPDLVAEHLSRGDQALAENDHGRALAAYAHAHEIAPTSARVQRSQMWARVHLMADSPSRVASESLTDIAYETELALAMSASDPSKIAICRTAQANVAARRGDVSAAKAHLADAIKSDPTSAIAHAAFGLLLAAEREQNSAAKAEFRLALQHNPNNVTAHWGLGQLSMTEGDLAGATSSFAAALQKRDDPTVRTALGNVLLQQNKHAEAASHLERVTLVEPRNADAWSGLGQALLGLLRLEEAERALRTAISLRSDEPTVVALGYTLTRLKKLDQALTVFTQVLGQNSTSAAALYGAGLASEDRGRRDEALTYYTRLLALAAEGAQKALVVELQKEAKTRVDVLHPTPPPAQDPPTTASASDRAPSPPLSSAVPVPSAKAPKR